jgi:hypothetical protein
MLFSPDQWRARLVDLGVVAPLEVPGRLDDADPLGIFGRTNTGESSFHASWLEGRSRILRRSRLSFRSSGGWSHPTRSWRSRDRTPWR